MKIRKLSKREVDASPHLIWNSFINLLAAEKYADLTCEQRPSKLVFVYESEVQNGGHMQYFENCALEKLSETIEALGLLGAPRHQSILRDAVDALLSRERHPIKTAEEYCSKALENEFFIYDNRFYQCIPSLQECLERHLRENQPLFVEIV